ncbi:uncharacterized protein LOC107432827 isoform X1 [Ziziphus jujuba]|uniref:Uncharacterized protein LOC107432827 isoform X1 n=2 Tax=Ziziphus jujuba TaxID=326968 RepID=A0A6P4AN36_ZIZJJ|nr:uncharacterized protein LOC107432827 isoform X1 [Ziziphus jujuba]
MEHFRTKRSKIASITERSSVSKEQGNKQVQNPRNFPKLASDSSSCSSGTTDEDSFTFELGWRSYKQANGTPMKKLLAKEMSRETESKRRSPSVIAKLMGLDGLPPQQSACKQPKNISDNHVQNTRSVEKGQRSSMGYNHRSSRKSSKEEQEFKDVFEVLETSKVGSCSYSSQVTENPKLTDAEMAFIRQKFMDAKRFSTDEKLQDSKEFHDALEVLESNKDLLLKFLKQPDSLFTKHLHDLQGATSQAQPRCGRMVAMKSSEVQKYDNTRLGSKSAREAPWKSCSISPQKQHDWHSSHSDIHHDTQSSLKSTKNLLERRDESAVLPTRIVVLKPNVGKLLNPSKTISAPCSTHASLSECRKDGDIPNIKNRETEFGGKKNFHQNVGLSRHKSRESRELAKEITRQMRNSFSSGSMNIASSAFKGYAGDESSCSMSGNESEVVSVTSKYSFDLNNQSRPASSHSTESSVSREAKKRLSERWRMTHKSQDLRGVSRGSTLADMLAIPDKEMRSAHLDSMRYEEGFSNKFATDDETAGWVEPLGISSRDGWKDGCGRNLTRSRSLPASSTASGSPKAIMRRETIRDERYVIPKDALKRERNKSAKGNLDKKEGVNKNSRLRSKKSSRSTIRDNNDTSFKSHTMQNHIKADFEESSHSEQNVEALKPLAGGITDTSPFHENIVDVDRENPTFSSESPHKILPELSACMLATDDCHADNQDNLNSQEPQVQAPREGSVPLHHSVPGLESPASSKETDQPSPVSVLEVPFIDDVSSCSECFESISADLQGLRMQLQLLKLDKLESESYTEGPMLISSDEDNGEGSTGFSDAIGIFQTQESWESSYMIQVLTDSGLSNTDPNMFVASWHSRERPVSLSVFEDLEKKYHDQTSLPKSERRLLFDRINSGLLEIYEQFTDPHPWARPAIKMVVPRWIKDGLQDGLRRLLKNQEKNAKKDTADKVLGRESEWLDMGDDIDVIGTEVERLLLDELLSEVVVAI